MRRAPLTGLALVASTALCLAGCGSGSSSSSSAATTATGSAGGSAASADAGTAGSSASAGSSGAASTDPAASATTSSAAASTGPAAGSSSSGAKAQVQAALDTVTAAAGSSSIMRVAVIPSGTSIAVAKGTKETYYQVNDGKITKSLPVTDTMGEDLLATPVNSFPFAQVDAALAAVKPCGSGEQRYWVASRVASGAAVVSVACGKGSTISAASQFLNGKVLPSLSLAEVATEQGIATLLDEGAQLGLDGTLDSILVTGAATGTTQGPYASFTLPYHTSALGRPMVSSSIHRPLTITASDGLAWGGVATSTAKPAHEGTFRPADLKPAAVLTALKQAAAKAGALTPAQLASVSIRNLGGELDLYVHTTSGKTAFVPLG